MVTGWPNEVIQRLRNRVRRVANSDRVAEFYIGRTAYPTQTKSRHGADDLHPIYKTTSVNNSEVVEQALLDRFFDHPKCNNVSRDSRGGVADGNLHYVYVAVWQA